MLALVTALHLLVLVTWGANAFAWPWLVAEVVFLIQLPRGHPLARQWALYVAGLLILMGVPVGLALLPLGLAGAVWFLGAATLGVLLLWGMSGPEVRRYFHLRCGYCGSYRTRARSFLHKWVRCRDCGQSWRWDDPHVNPSIFD
ncbi:MAG: hypothetical protein ACYTEZ_17955 [Planctomycetota bacterium]